MLKRLIAHKILKEPHKNKAVLQLREEVLPVNSELAAQLLEQLRDSLQSGNPISGVFKSTGDTQPRFQQILLRYLEANNDAAFISFTTEAMKLLRDEMVKQQAATGGFVVFAEYEVNDTNFMLSALLSTTEKPNFDDDLNLIATNHPDLDHLRHGARIRLADAANNTEGVIQFVSKLGRGVSDYFVDFIGCEEVTRPDVQGRNLHTALDAWATQERMDEDRRRQLMQQAYSYWQDCRRQGNPMTLTALANALSPQNPRPLLRHLGREDHQLAGEFSAPPPSVMKRFIKFAFNAHGLRLEFDRNNWENRVTVNHQTRTLTIRDVPEDLIAALDEGT